MKVEEEWKRGVTVVTIEFVEDELAGDGIRWRGIGTPGATG